MNGDMMHLSNNDDTNEAPAVYINISPHIRNKPAPEAGPSGDIVVYMRTCHIEHHDSEVSQIGIRRSR